MSRQKPPLRVLVVEDDPDNGQLFQDILELSGYEVQLVRTGREAIAILRDEQARPHALLLDFDLRDMTGRQVLAATAGRRNAVPILLVSASRDVAALARELDVDCVVAKPFNPEWLLARLAECVAGEVAG